MANEQILWADDEIELLTPHIIFLQTKGYDVTTVNNGLDAVEEVKKKYFDLVFLDENMPGISGLEVLKEMKEYRGDLPIVMITKNEEEDVMEDAIGTKIDDYLIKPVNPNQILLSIKKILDKRSLVNEKTTSGYQQEFRNIGLAVNEKLSFEEWKSLYKKLVNWEIRFDKSHDTGMEEVFSMQKQEANKSFCKYVEDNYLDFIPYENSKAPIMSHTLIRKGVLPEHDSSKPFFFLLIDNLRFDQWKVISPLISEYFRVDKEDLYLSILPTTTQYCRNSIFAGLMPADIEKRFPGKWSNDEDEGGKNNYEEDFLTDLFKRLMVKFKTKYTKVVNLDQAKAMLDDIPNMMSNDFNAIVYNFVDSLSHARTDYKIMRELAEEEPAYRSLTLSWFEHSPLWDAMKKIAEKGGKIVISTDHGSVRVTDPVKVIGDKNTTTNLRYKTGKNLTYNKKEVFEIAKPETALLPRQHLSSSFIFTRENGYFVYPNNMNHYTKYYHNTFQHGGISLEEMFIPLITLSAKPGK
ncbi:MAG: PglZ domain-containing protein [Flavobacteriales bacterium]|nr:PglZ domain-containing protein [Flavobacteriales bacterium]